MLEEGLEFLVEETILGAVDIRFADLEEFLLHVSRFRATVGHSHLDDQSPAAKISIKGGKGDSLGKELVGDLHLQVGPQDVALLGHKLGRLLGGLCLGF